MSDRSLRGRIARPALALGAGALTAFSLPPWGWWPLAFVGVALFEISLGDEPDVRRRVGTSALFAAGWMYLGMGWMVQLTAPGYVIAGFIFTCFHALAGALAPTGRWRVIGRPAAHTLAEALRLSFPFGGVPLATLGISQVAGPFGGIARVGGVIVITWIVFQIGFSLGVLTRSTASSSRREQSSAPGEGRTSGRGDRAALTGLVVALLVLGASLVAPTGSPTGEVLRVAAVQGGGAQGTTALEVPSALVTDRHLEATRTIPDDAALDLVLWPENTIDIDDDRSTDVFENFANSERREQIAAEAARIGVPVAVGVTEDAMTDEPRFTNAQVVVAPDGAIVSRFDKVRRVPFGEYVPLRGLIEKVSSAVDRVGEAVAGTDRAILTLPDGTTLAVVISWEVFFAGRAREGVVDGATAIINPTNGSSYTGTIVQTQQVASSRLRAIETGRWVVQAAPTGFTAIVEADGTVRQRTSVSEQRVLYDTVELRSGTTWYTSIGDGPLWWAVGLVFVASVIASRRRGDGSLPDEERVTPRGS